MSGNFQRKMKKSRKKLNKLVLKKSNNVSQIADMSVISFIKTIASIRKSHKLFKYRKNKELNERIPNYTVKMGFGLHVGWAIEGAIGSDFKIDASYLSPNVNMASRLEAATKQFGVPLLISGKLYDIMTTESAAHMRHIDTVTVKGSNEPMRLYTCDLEFTNLKIERVNNKNLTKQEKKAKKVQARIERNRYREKAFSNQLQVSMKFELDSDIEAMRANITKEFTEMFKQGFNEYISGNWEKAKEYLDQVEEYKYPDNPTRLLLHVMGEFGYQAPDNWEGYRKLTSK